MTAIAKRPVIISGKSTSKWLRYASGIASCSTEGNVSQSPVQAGKTMATTIVRLRAICRSPAQAQRQIARNLTIVVAMVLPACTGLWLTLPSVEQLAIPEAYRSHFDVLLPLMMTGLFAMAVIQYGISPIFQIEKKTMPLIVAAL